MFIHGIDLTLVSIVFWSHLTFFEVINIFLAPGTNAKVSLSVLNKSIFLIQIHETPGRAATVVL